MNTLFLSHESIVNGLSDLVLPLLKIVAITCGILVIISKNPIVSVLFLIGLFLSIALYLIALGINFIGISYLLVYVGAVSILFLFILMLINIRISELLSETSKSLPLAIFTAIIFNYLSFAVLPNNANVYNNFNIATNTNNLLTENIYGYFSYIYGEVNNVMLVTSDIWDGSIGQVGHITSIGNIMYTNVSIWLILTSVILLLAMVGAIVITLSPSKTMNN